MASEQQAEHDIELLRRRAWSVKTEHVRFFNRLREMFHYDPETGAWTRTGAGQLAIKGLVDTRNVAFDAHDNAVQIRVACLAQNTLAPKVDGKPGQYKNASFADICKAQGQACGVNIMVAGNPAGRERQLSTLCGSSAHRSSMTGVDPSRTWPPPSTSTATHPTRNAGSCPHLECAYLAILENATVQFGSHRGYPVLVVTKDNGMKLNLFRYGLLPLTGGMALVAALASTAWAQEVLHFHPSRQAAPLALRSRSRFTVRFQR
jgi:hypothetical protein